MVDQNKSGSPGSLSSDAVSVFRSLTEAEMVGSGLEFGVQSKDAQTFVNQVAEWVVYLGLGRFAVRCSFLRGEPWQSGSVMDVEVTEPPMSERAGGRLRVEFQKNRATVNFYQTTNAATLGYPDDHMVIRFDRTRRGEDPRDQGGNVKSVAQAITTMLWQHVAPDEQTKRSKLYRGAEVPV